MDSFAGKDTALRTGATARSRRVLVTGGAGFIGSHVADELLEHGYRVRVLDNLDPQVHGPEAEWPAHLDADIELQRGDVRDPDAVHRALEGVDAVFHFAAAVGVGQSMYEIGRYTDINVRGTAVLLEALSRAPVARLVVGSSMAVYGEGLYCDAGGRRWAPPERSPAQLGAERFEVEDDHGVALVPMMTPETTATRPSSVYALAKLDQEKLCLMIGAAHDIPVVALRFFNVYGTRQALSNPYSGSLAAFATRLLNHSAPIIHEDGRQRRDYVSVHDVARACRLALEAPGAPGHVFNVGSGESVAALDVAAALATVMGVADVQPEVTHQFRLGDIRHCFADITLARLLLDYSPRVRLEDGLAELGEWIRSRKALDRLELVGREPLEWGVRA